MEKDFSVEPLGESIWPAADRRAVCTRITNHVYGEAENIVSKMIDFAKEGNCQAMKYLFEMAGLFPAAAESEEGEKDTLSTRLRDRFETILNELNGRNDAPMADSTASLP